MNIQQLHSYLEWLLNECGAPPDMPIAVLTSDPKEHDQLTVVEAKEAMVFNADRHKAYLVRHSFEEDAVILVAEQHRLTGELPFDYYASYPFAEVSGIIGAYEPTQ